MFDKPFEQLFRAVERIEQRLEQVNDAEQKQVLAEELIALRNACDIFIEKWLAFEERVAYIGEKFGLELDGSLSVQEIQGLHTAWTGMMLAGEEGSPIAFESPPGPAGKSAQEILETIEQQEGQEVAKKIQGKFLLVPEMAFPKSGEEQLVRAFRRGMGYFDLLMFAEAVEEFEKVVRLDSDFVIARLYLALGYLGKQDYESATRHLRLASLGENNTFILATIHNTFGHIYAGQGQYLDAAKEFAKVIELLPSFRDAFFNLGVCHYHVGAYQDALYAFERAAALEDDWEAERLIGYSWIRLGHPERALPHFEKAYRLNSLNEHVLLELADLYQNLGFLRAAKSLLRKAHEYFPQAADVVGSLGWLAMREGRFSEAISLFKKQLSIHPHHPQALLNLGWACMKSGDLARAERCLRDLLRLKPGQPQALAGLAQIRWLQGDQQGAKTGWAELSQEDSAEARKLGNLYLGRLAIEEERYRDAVDHLNTALLYDRSCAETHFFKGLAHYALGERAEAEQCFENCRAKRRRPYPSDRANLTESGT
jgi:tetratricopeptide (TPR) repeat protein